MRHIPQLRFDNLTIKKWIRPPEFRIEIVRSDKAFTRPRYILPTDTNKRVRRRTDRHALPDQITEPLRFHLTPSQLCYIAKTDAAFSFSLHRYNAVRFTSYLAQCVSVKNFRVAS